MLHVMRTWWNRRYPDWEPEIALRYLPVVESIRAESSRGLILEVGVQQYYRVHRGDSFPFLDEHVANGLPRLKALPTEMEGIAEDTTRRRRFHCEPNLNVWVHGMLLRLWMRTDRVSYVLHRLAIVLIHVLRWLNVGPCYRQIIVAEFHSSYECL